MPEASICFSVVQCQRPICVPESGPPATETLTMRWMPARSAGRERVGLELDLVGRGDDEQEDAVDCPRTRPAERLGLRQVADHDLDAGMRMCEARSGSRTRARDRDAGGRELPDDLLSDLSRGACYEDHGAPPLSSRMRVSAAGIISQPTGAESATG